MEKEREYKAHEIISLLSLNRRTAFLINKKYKSLVLPLKEWKKKLKL